LTRRHNRASFTIQNLILFLQMDDNYIEVVEVGPRDGLQNTSTCMPSADKMAWISGARAAGLKEIEVCSFVPPSRFPQFADRDLIVAHALGLPGLTVSALVPNVRGARDALSAGVPKLSFTLSVSRAHSLANVRKTPADQLVEFRRIDELRRMAAPKAHITGGLSTAFGCTIEGAVEEREVCRLAAALIEAGADDVSLADTVGYATPAQVKRLVGAVRREIGSKLTTLHLHDTRGLGLANVMAGLECGIRAFDASLGGLGGCPHAPGASGNICTEDLVFMLEGVGLRTGVDLEALLEVRKAIERALPGEILHGAVARAGLPRGWQPAARNADGEYS
jgi:hydroxymethylglutaryl-CoA lyase